MTKRFSLIRSGMVNILALCVLYVISQFFFTNIRLFLVELPGVMAVLIIAAIIGLVWVVAYWLIDREQGEPIYMVLSTVILGILAYLVAIPFLGGILGGIFDWSCDNPFLQNLTWLLLTVILPSGSIFLTLRMVIMVSRHFNEAVDGMIYGGILGTGFALASSLDIVLSLQSVNLHFLVLTLITRVSMYAALAALGGYFLGYAKIKRQQRNLYMFASILSGIILFFVQAVLERVLQFDLLRNSLDIWRFGLALFITGAVVSFMLFLVQQTISAEPDTEIIEKGEFRHFDVITAVYLAMICILLVGGRISAEWKGECSTVDGQWSFMLPKVFQEVPITPSLNSLLAAGNDTRGLSRYIMHRSENRRTTELIIDTAPGEWGDGTSRSRLSDVGPWSVSVDTTEIDGVFVQSYQASRNAERFGITVKSPAVDRMSAEVVVRGILASIKAGGVK